MKKRIAILLAIVIVASFTLAACGGSPSPSTPTSPSTSSSPSPSESTAASASVAPTDSGTAVAGKTSTGLGHAPVTLSDKSADGVSKSQVNGYFCSATFAEDGTINSMTIDCAQVNSDFTGGALVGAGDVKTKNEQGADYNMVKFGGAIAEWNVQAESFCQWATGKKYEDVIAMKTKAKDDEHPSVPDEADLTSKVTIDVGHFIEALKNAYANKKDDSAETAASGLGNAPVTLTDKSADGVSKSQVNAYFAAVSFAADGTITAMSIDSAQVNTDFTGGALAGVGDVKTKNELGADYNMVKYGGAIAEWNVQAESFCQWAVGKKYDDVIKMKTNTEGAPDEADLTSKVTIGVGEFLAALQDAYANKK